MRAAMSTVVIVLLIVGAGCEAGGDEVDLEPGEATEGVPGAAGSVTPHQWDTDLDGRLSRDEFEVWWREEAQSSEWAAAEGEGEGLDSDGDGTVSDEERTDWWFDRLDTDDDGFVNSAEREAAPGS